MITKLFFLLLFVSSCSSIPKEEAILEVAANQEAIVSYYDQETDKVFELGKTPFKMNKQELLEKASQSPWVYLLVSAQGFVPEHIVLPKESRSMQKIKINLNLIFSILF